MKRIAILGSTGSIGRQTLEVVRMYPGDFSVEAISANRNVELLLKQAKEFNPSIIAITDEFAGNKFLTMYKGNAEVIIGKDSISEIVKASSIDLVLISVVGISGLKPTLNAINSGKEIALANKETLVAGGSIVMNAAKNKKIVIKPVDSEHSAIFQCLMGQDKSSIHKILLTASGGPFRGKTKEELKFVTVNDALKHPTWNMGLKVTLDSATMFNKGLELIEAHWLFNVDYEKIDILIQPQSLIHSMVEFNDGSVIAQIGNPDMRIPIQFALTYPDRKNSPSRQYVDWKKYGNIILEKPDVELFKSLKMAYYAGKSGGNMTTAYNAANEEAIKAFIDGKINFLQIFDVVESVLNKWDTKIMNSFEDVLISDKNARINAKREISKINF
ncbi:1-deoxy-D-xylulose-5-phosphate reductoisomerase [Dialister micraerophilus]|uniref:1-deoxy-D-xylulose 5-phosphate reductoisomerase n=1 Tax=Dialister micraerophilus UPII 345-E TaxID=910314 RepID=E4L8R6_9FIRM|nr:1-deoxy-D-xylulose-5-phosphate reductoisomerase [Dialister micraerophilus]EFR42835.1 1-deoxy-D-xylulose 5-phosphate reductoisomerase [Dialister micraerophilus UPII 345-E]